MKYELQKFLILFTRLQRETNNSPNNLGWIITEKPYLSEQCWVLNYLYREISRLLIRKREKHTITPHIFFNKWEDYKKNWESTVAEAATIEEERIWKELIKDFPDADEGTPEESSGPKVNIPEGFFQNLSNVLASKHEERLDPLVDDPAEIMKDLYYYIKHFVDNDDEVFKYQQLEAWDFFTDTIGIDYSAIYGRWQNAPELFIPTNLLSRNITPLEELYNEAVRAYIFGITEASVAMCRALMEHIFRKYYHFSGDNLADIIAKAERKHRYLKELKLHHKRDLANKVLHEYENHGKEIEKAAFDFLQTIRHLVTGIPTP